MIILIKYIKYCLFLFFLFGSLIQSNNNYINTICKKHYGFFYVVLPINKNGIYEDYLNNSEYFYQYYKEHFSNRYKSFYEYYFAVINRLEVLNYDIVKDELDLIKIKKTKIIEEFNKYGFTYIRKHYLISCLNGFRAISFLEGDDLNSLIYVMFNNNFYSSYFDIDGTTRFLYRLK